MSFDDLPPQPPINPKADAYGLECLRLSRAAAATARCLLDVPYGADYWQKIDIFLPPGRPARPVPIFMFMHGGGWCWGYKEWCSFMAPAFVAAPAIFISVSYRLIPDVAFPAAVEDTARAIKWVWDHIGEHGGDRERIVIGGHSAGAHIAALLAVQPRFLTQAGLPANAVKAAMCLSATFNRRMIDPRRAPDHVPAGEPADIAPDSPIALAAGAKVPFYIAWGGKEHERLERSGRQMIAALQQTGCPVDHVVFPADDHFSIHLKTANPDDPWTRTVLRYLQQQPAAAA